MQQVNLYLPEFQPRRDPVNARQMGLILLALLAVILLWSIWSASRTNSLEARLESEQAELQAAQMQVQELSARLPAQHGASVDEEIAELRAELARREQILHLITQQNLGNADGFSAQLQAMARQSLDDMALSGFSLQSGGSYVELAGRVRQPERVPEYLQRLRQESSFSHVSFGVLTLAQESDEKGPGLAFSVRRATGD